MLDIERYMESFKESISKRFEKQEENFKNQRNTDENEDIEQQHVINLNFSLFFSFFVMHLY